MTRIQRFAVLLSTAVVGGFACHAETSKEPDVEMQAEEDHIDVARPEWTALIDLPVDFAPTRWLTIEVGSIPPPPAINQPSVEGKRWNVDLGPRGAWPGEISWRIFEVPTACKVVSRTDSSTILGVSWIQQTKMGPEHFAIADDKGELISQEHYARDSLGRIIELEVHSRDRERCHWTRERQSFRYDAKGAVALTIVEYLDDQSMSDHVEVERDGLVFEYDGAGLPIRGYRYGNDLADLTEILEYTWSGERLTGVKTFDQKRKGKWKWGQERRFTWLNDYVRVDVFVPASRDPWRHEDWTIYERLGPNDYREWATASEPEKGVSRLWSYETSSEGETITVSRGDVEVQREHHRVINGALRLISKERRLVDAEDLVVVERWNWAGDPVIRQSHTDTAAYYLECESDGAFEIEQASRECPPPKFGEFSIELEGDLELTEVSQ